MYGLPHMHAAQVLFVAARIMWFKADNEAAAEGGAGKKGERKERAAAGRKKRT